jgi:hypothetical protein
MLASELRALPRLIEAHRGATTGPEGHRYTSRAMKFSWKALVLAPSVVPLLFALAFISSESKSPILAFLFIFVLGCVLSYGTTIFLLLPSLYLLSKLVVLRWYLVCALGAVLGAVLFFPVAWLSFRSSGPDSGSPEGTFIEFLSRSSGDAFTWLFPVGGLITAMAYWVFVRNTPQKSSGPE